MAKVSTIRINEKEYSVPAVLSYETFVTVFAKTASDAKKKVLNIKPKKLRKQAAAPVIKTGRAVVVSEKTAKVSNG